MQLDEILFEHVSRRISTTASRNLLNFKVKGQGHTGFLCVHAAIPAVGT